MPPKIKKRLVTHGVNDAVKLSMATEGATVADAHALLRAIAQPTRTLAQEVAHWKAALSKRKIAEPFKTKMVEHIQEAEGLLTLEGVRPADVRSALERARFVEYQAQAAPLAVKGKKFDRPGRGRGSVRKAVDKLLKGDPTLKNQALWDAIKAKPPRGYVVCDNRLGKYIEAPTGHEDVRYRSFQNICSEARRSLKKS